MLVVWHFDVMKKRRPATEAAHRAADSGRVRALGQNDLAGLFVNYLIVQVGKHLAQLICINGS